jgi:drug/metabolite transporter (DMT)-like permease
MWRAYLTLVGLGLVWGTSFILIKKGLKVFDPAQVACLRMSLSASAFIPMLVFNRKRMEWDLLPYLILVGLTSSAIPAILFATAQTQISSSTAGILNSLTPLFTLVTGVLIFGSRASWMQVIGVLLGLTGAAFLILYGKTAGSQGSYFYAGLVVLATVCYAIGTNTIGTKLKKLNSLIISSASFGIVGVPMFFYLLLGTDFVHRLQHVPHAWEALGYVTILSWVGTVICSIIYFKLIQDTTAIFGSTVAYLMPLMAMVWGIADGETVGWAQLIGMGLILSGVYLTRK